MAMLVLFGMQKKDTIYGEDTSFPGVVYIHKVYGARMPKIAMDNFTALFGQERKEWGVGMYILQANGAEFMSKEDVEKALDSLDAQAFRKRCIEGTWWSDFIS